MAASLLKVLDLPGVLVDEREPLADVKMFADLRDKLTAYLQPPSQKGLVAIHQPDVELAGATGNYVLPGLVVSVRGGRAVSLVPVRSLRDGDTVQADLVCGARRVRLQARQGDRWSFRKANGEISPLSEDSFSSALGELLR